MLFRVLLLFALVLLLSKLFFRGQWGAIKKWMDGVVNALLIAIAIVCTIQLLIWLTS